MTAGITADDRFRNWHFTPDEAAYILRDCAAKVLVAHADLLAQIAPGIPAGVEVLVVPTPAGIGDAYNVPCDKRQVPAGLQGWDAFVLASASNSAPAKMARGSMIYTSGSTGRPRGVRRQPSTPEQQEAAASGLRRYWGLVADDPSIVVLMNGPMYHSAPAAYGMASARIGLPMVLQPRFDAEGMLRLIDKHRISHMHIVPTMFVRLLRLPEEVRRRYDLSSLRCVVHGAAPCPPAVKRQMIEWWGPVINEYYGATETGVVVAHTSEEALRKPGTVGHVIEGATLRIVDEQGRDVKRGEVGEIYLRGPHGEFTYNNDDAKRREVALGDLVTVGDVGYQDADGYLFLCDRKRDMIISGGVNIYPAEIEAVLIQMPGVRDCAVFGIPDEEFGEQICAYVEPLPGAGLDAASVRAFLGQHLARYKVPKVVELSAALPREDSGKILKRRLRAPYWEKTGRNI